jgi:hypothetical protein
MPLLFKTLLSAVLIIGCAKAQAAEPADVIFENVRIFNGSSDRLSAPSNMLVVGNVIKAISCVPIAAPPGISVTRIQEVGRGRIRDKVRTAKPSIPATVSWVATIDAPFHQSWTSG